MSEFRLKTEYWIHAHLRQCSAAGVPAVVVRRGDKERGLVILKVNTLTDGCFVFTQSRNLDGALAWLPALNGDAVAERDADNFIDRQVGYDPDVWVVEIEDKQGRRWFEGDLI